MLKFLRERRESIEDGLKKSELAQQQFKEMRGLQARELAKTRHEAQKIIDEAKKRAETAQKEIVAAGKAQTEALFDKAQKDIDHLKNQRLAEAEKEIGRIAIEGLEYMLKEKVSEERKSSLQDDAVKYIKLLKNPS